MKPVLRTLQKGLLLVCATAFPAECQSQGTLAWRGTSGSPNWDANPANLNWFDGTMLVPYADGTNVVFDSSAAFFAPTLPAAVMPGSVTFNGTNSYTLGGSGKISGSASLTNNSSGTLTLNNANDFTGIVQVNSGTLKAGNNASLGATNGITVIANGATLDINAKNLGFESVVVQGAGVGGAGAINNTSGTGQQSAIRYITLSGDATFSASGNRWDLYNTGFTGAQLAGNGYTLTKIGGNVLFIKDCGDTGLGDIHVVAGRFGFQGAVGAGDTNKTCTIEPGAILSIFYAAGPDNLTKRWSLNNGGAVDSGGQVNNIYGPVSLTGTNTFGVRSELHLWGPISGPGGLIATINSPVGNGPAGTTLNLHSANSYTGVTIVRNNTRLLVDADADLGESSLVQLDGGSKLDVSTAAKGLTLGSGQKLIGGAGVTAATIFGSVTNGPASTIGAGTSSSGLMVVDNLDMHDATNLVAVGSVPGDVSGATTSYIQVNQNLSLEGLNTIKFTPVGVPDTNMPYIVMAYFGALTGDKTNLTAVGTNPRYTAMVLDPATTVPYIEIQLSISTNSQPLVWKGGSAPSPNVWDHSTTNWLNVNTAIKDQFHEGDTVTFDDSAVTNKVNVTEAVAPGGLTFNVTNANYTFNGTGSISAGALDLEGPGSVTFAVSNAPAIASIINPAGKMILIPSNTAPYTFSAELSDAFMGAGTLIFGGSNTVTLTGNNDNYLGVIAVTNGILRYNNAVALGNASANPLVITNQGTLDFNGVNANTKPILFSGDGYQGQGALIGSGAVIRYLTMGGDASIGANGTRWDQVTGSSSFAGNGFNLSKVGTGDVFLHDSQDTGIGNIRVTAGRLAFQGDVGLGDPAKTATVEAGGILVVYSNPELLDKHLVLTNGGTFDSGGMSNNFMGSITVYGTNIISARDGGTLHLWGPITGGGGVMISPWAAHPSAPVYMDGTNTFTGPAILASGTTVFLGTNSTLNTSPLIVLNSGSSLDLTAPAALTIGSGQILTGIGAINGGNVSVGTGGTLAPGLPGNTSALTLAGNLSFAAGSTNVVILNKTAGVANSMVTGLNSVSIGGGTLVVQNIGSGPAGGDMIPLFGAAGYSGNFTAIVPSTPGPGLSWDASTIPMDGILRVTDSGVNTTSTNIITQISGNQLTLSWPADHIGWKLQVQTNNFGAGLGAIWYTVPDSEAGNQQVFTISPANGSVFYRLVYP